MNPVPVLIFNALARREKVSLPEIGSLEVTYRPAFKNAEGVVMPPMNRVELSKREAADGVNIIGLIMQNSDADHQAAERIYRKWLEESTSDGTVTIENVGIIKSDFLTMDPQMKNTLNPAAVRAVELKKRSNSMLYWAISIAAIVGSAISVIIITYLERGPEPEKDFIFPQSAEQTSAAFAAETPSDTVILQEETVAAVVVPADQVKANKPAAKAPQAQVPTGPAYYVIIGAYSTDANADRFIAQSKTLDNTQNYQKLTLNNGKIMVYTSRWGSEQEARKARKMAAFPEAWIFKYRR